MITEQERKILAKQLVNLEDQQKENAVTAGGLDSTEQDAAENEMVAKKQFDTPNSIIMNYEKEIDGMIGEYITLPISETDIDKHSSSSGRLYQGFNGTHPKRIPEFDGGGLSSTLRPSYELISAPKLIYVLKSMMSGMLPIGGSSSSLPYDYSSGQAQIMTRHAMSPGWYMVNRTSLLRISSSERVPAVAATEAFCSKSMYLSESSCKSAGGVWTPATEGSDEYYRNTISERYAFGLDYSAPKNSTITPWSGYSESERISKVASSTSQQMMDAMLSFFNDKLSTYMSDMGRASSGTRSNQDPSLDKSVLAHYEFMESYLKTKGLNNESIVNVIAILNSRTTSIPSRAQYCRISKAKFYSERYDTAKFRCDYQSGTLTRVKFVNELRGFFPKNGDKGLAEQISRVKKILQDG